MADNTPAFESLPSAVDIMNWFLAEKKHESNVGGDAWWLAREPHSSCWRLAHVDYDVQEFWLLEVTTGETSDMLWVTDGLNGKGYQWWRNPRIDVNAYWRRDGIVWMANQIVLVWEL